MFDINNWICHNETVIYKVLGMRYSHCVLFSFPNLLLFDG